MTEKSQQLSEQDKELISSIYEDFNKKSFISCERSLTKLENSLSAGGVHPKIMHNKAVAEFFKSELRKFDSFKKSIIQCVGENNHVVEIKSASLCPIYYNLAVLLFHTKQSYSALKIMEAVMLHIDQLDQLINKAGLLTVTLLLETNQAKKADKLLEMLQNRLDINYDDILESDALDLIEKKKEESSEEQDVFRKLFGLILIRSNLLNDKPTIIPQEKTADYSILKGHQYFLKHDYQMAAKELSRQFTNEPNTVKKHGEDQNVCLANNMGLIHFSVKHYALAVRFFQQGLNKDQKAIKSVKKDFNNQLPLHCLGATKRPELLYNLGISLLYLQRPKDAFDCLLVPLNIYHKNPKLWLRLAECCIMVHKQNLLEIEKQNKNIVTSIIGSGMHRKYILTPTPHKYITDEQSSAIPSPNLEFASLCLRNALTMTEYFNTVARIVESTEQRSSDDIKAEQEFSLFGNNWNKTNDGVPCNPSKPLTVQAIEKLHIAILASYSYVSICLGEYTLAFKHAKSLLQMNNLPDTHKMLGNLYCAESLIMLDRVSEALVFLEPKIIKELKGVDFETRHSPDWQINTIDAAQSVLAYNLAVALVMKEEYELAKKPMTVAQHPVVQTKLKMLEIYLQLRSDNIENCYAIIKRDTPQIQ